MLLVTIMETLTLNCCAALLSCNRCTCCAQLYLTAAVAALMAPAVVERMGPGRAMIISSLGFPLYVASVTYIALPAVFATSISKIVLCVSF